VNVVEEVTGAVAATVEETGVIGSCSTAVYAGADAAELKLEVLGEALTFSVAEVIVLRTSVTVVVHDVDAVTARTIAAGDSDGGLQKKSSTVDQLTAVASISS